MSAGVGRQHPSRAGRGAGRSDAQGRGAAQGVGARLWRHGHQRREQGALVDQLLQQEGHALVLVPLPAKRREEIEAEGGGQRLSRRHSNEAARKGRSEGRAHLNEPMPPGRWCWDAHADAQQCGMASERLIRAKLPEMQQGSLKRAHAQVGGDGVDGLRVLHALLSDVQSGQVQAKRADLRATRVKGRQ